MPRFPYERIAPEADKLIQKMTLATDLKTVNYWWDVYVSFLEGAGWDPISFDRETEKRIDEGWEDPKPPVIWN